MNLILTHILAQVQFNRNVIHQCTKWKLNLSPLSSGYIQQQHKKNVKMPKKNMEGSKGSSLQWMLYCTHHRNCTLTTM